MLNHAVINRDEVARLEKLIESKHKSDIQKGYWRDDLDSLKTNPGEYWNGFITDIQIRNKTQLDRINTVKFMQEYYKSNPAPKSEQLQLF